MQLSEANKIIINVNKENWKLDTVELTCNVSFSKAETG